MHGSDQPACADPIFDPTFLDAYTGGDNEVRNEVLELFLEQASLLLSRLEAARGDPQAWHLAAHSLKGCARGVGAKKVADLALEAEGRSGALADIQMQMLNDLHAAMAATSERVRDILRQG